MPDSYNPFSTADLPLTLAGLNTRFQSVEDYFKAAIASGAATQTTIEAEAGEGLSDRSPAYLNTSDNKIYLMDSDAAGPQAGYIRGFVDGTFLTGATATLVINGLLDGFSSLTPFLPVYVATIAGTVTQTRPSPSSGGSQVMVAQMGVAITDEVVVVRTLPIQYHKRNAMSENDLLTLSHHADDRGYTRNVWAYITQNDAGAAAVNYASSNQDEDVSLENSGIDSYTADQCTGGTPIGNMTDSGGLAAAFDNNASTYAQKASAVAGTIGYDFGTTKVIRRYTVQEPTTVGATGMARTWTLEYSTDNVAWNVADTRSSETSWGDGEIRTFDVSADYTARYWRLNVTNNNGGPNLNIGEVEMFEAVYAEYDKLAQLFALSGAETIASVGLWLKKVGSPTGTATVRIETVSAGEPTGTLAHADATGTFAESGLGTSYAEQVVTFANEFELLADDYALVLSTSRAASDTNYVQWGADGSSPSYSGGEMKALQVSTWSNLSKDAVFAVYNPGLSHPSRVAVDWWESTHADMVNRYGDGSGADLSTETTFKCVAAAGFDDITVVVEIA